MAITINYILADGTQKKVNAEEGEVLRHLAVNNCIDGIVGECGGCMVCATCHVYVDESFVSLLPAMEEGENDMLDSTVAERLPNSRLSCQLKASKTIDGIILRCPPTQL